jgi:hypothetical protein
MDKELFFSLGKSFITYFIYLMLNNKNNEIFLFFFI